MGKGNKKGKNRKKRERRSSPNPDILPALGYEDEGGYHAFMPGLPPTEDQLDKMTLDYQERIRKSPLWKKIVKRFGSEMAEELLKECKVELR